VSPAQRAQIQPGPVQADVERASRRLAERTAVRRIWGGDPSLWTEDPAHSRIVANRLGWLSVVETMQARLDELRAFADDVRAAGLRRAVLLGMGGSSLAPEMLRATFGTAPGFLELFVLDTTDPATIASLEGAAGEAHGVPLRETLFVVASKSGTTVETLSHLAYFWDRSGGRGEQFIAITDSGTPLESLAHERGFRRVFLNPPDIGGRYSALSYFGLVPAALLGLDFNAFLDRARDMAERCRQERENPGLELGALLGGGARAGRDKVTLLAPDEVGSFGGWIEQLLAESTGKQGTGLIPVVDEPLGGPEVYGSDRLFARFLLGPGPVERELGVLIAAGHPLVTIRLQDRLDLGAELFRWEFATAVAGAVLAIDPFDEPNVQESKDNTRRLLDEFEENGRLPEPAPIAEAGGLSLSGALRSATLEGGLAEFLASARPGDYLALQAYLPCRDEVRARLQAIRWGLRDRLRVATTLGFGPRFLHSTGQLHKGGPPSGLFLQLTADDTVDLPIPGQRFSFGVLRRAQALGDFQALQARGRPAVRFHLGADVEAGLRRLENLLSAP